MNKRQRVQAALRGEPVDRIPISLWRHFHRQDRSPSELAALTLSLCADYDLDLVKLTPSGLYGLEDWAGSHIAHPGTEHEPPYLRTPAISEPQQWADLTALEPATGALGRELEAIRLVAAGLNGQIPLIMTIFGPLTLAYKLAGDHVLDHLRRHPAALRAGLRTLADTTARFAQAALAAGADGVFFATQLASHRWLTPDEYEQFGVPYDSLVLEAVAARSWITVLHLHGQDVFFALADRLPIHAVSWHDRETPPSLAEARQRTRRALLSGLDRRLLQHGPTAAIQAQVRESISQTEGRSLILAPSCVVPTTAPAEHLQAVVTAL